MMRIIFIFRIHAIAILCLLHTACSDTNLYSYDTPSKEYKYEMCSYIANLRTYISENMKNNNLNNSSKFYSTVNIYYNKCNKFVSNKKFYETMIDNDNVHAAFAPHVFLEMDSSYEVVNKALDVSSNNNLPEFKNATFTCVSDYEKCNQYYTEKEKQTMAYYGCGFVFLACMGENIQIFSLIKNKK